jgi:hypothetical protein
MLVIEAVQLHEKHSAAKDTALHILEVGSKMHSSPQSRAKPFKRLTRSFQRTCALSHGAKSIDGQSVLDSLKHHSAIQLAQHHRMCLLSLGSSTHPATVILGLQLSTSQKPLATCRACRCQDAMSACGCDERMSIGLLHRSPSRRTPTSMRTSFAPVPTAPVLTAHVLALDDAAYNSAVQQS